MSTLITAINQLKEMNATELKQLIDIAWEVKFKKEKEELEEVKKLARVLS